MERFNYRSLAEVDAEDASIIYLLECEQWGYVMDREEELDEQYAELEVATDGQ